MQQTLSSTESCVETEGHKGWNPNGGCVEPGVAVPWSRDPRRVPRGGGVRRIAARVLKKAKVRPLEDADVPGVGELRIRAFPYLPEVREIEHYEIVYRWLGRHPLAGELRRWVAATEDGEVVGHLAATPQYYRIGDRRVVAHSPGDYMGHPDYGFQALMLMRKFFSVAENCVSLDMVPEVIGVQSRMGAKVAGQLRYAAKLLDVSRLPMPPVPAPVERLLLGPVPAQRDGHPGSEGMEQPPNPGGEAPAPRPRALIPAPAKTLMNGGLRVLDEALGGLLGGGPKVEVLDGFDESFDAFFEKVAAQTFCVPEKDEAFLRWRYGPGSPQAPVTVLGVRGAEGLLGYAVLRTVSGGHDGYILDLVALPGRRDVARALLFESVRSFRETGAHIIRYRFAGLSTSPGASDLLRMGFFRRDARRNTLMVKFADPDLHEKALDVDRWSYSIGDGEAAFWLR